VVHLLGEQPERRAGLAAGDWPVQRRSGVFYDKEQYEGHDITVRYKWSDITATTARWEQAFSLDNGQTWETNWTADFTRTD